MKNKINEECIDIYKKKLVVNKKINSLESRLTHKINFHDKDFSLKLESLSEKILPISTDLSNLMQSSSENDKKFEKLDTFEKFKSKYFFGCIKIII